MPPSSLRRLSFFVAAILIGAAVYFPSRQPVRRLGPAEVPAVVASPAVKTGAPATPAPRADCCPAVVGEPERVANPGARPVARPPAQVAGALDAFRTWAARYGAAPAEEKAALVPQGRALAEARRAAFGALIRQDPRTALGALLPYELRKALPPEIADTIEHRLSGVGDLMVVGVRPLPGTIVDEPIYRTASLQGTEYRAYTYGKRLGDVSRPQTPILGVGVTLADGSRLAAVRDEAYEVLEKAEAADLRAQSGVVQTICPVSAQPTESTGTETAVDTGRKVIWLCAGGHMEEWLRSPDGALVMAAGGSGNSGGTSPVNPATYTQGNKKFLAIRVRFADQAVGFEPATDATMQTEMQKVVDSLADWSYGKMEASFAFTPTLDLPGTQADYSTHGMSFLTSVARPLAAAYTDGTGAHPYNTANFDFDAVVFSTNVWGNYCGVAWVGTKGTMIKCASAGVFLHEWGHNFGLGHANFWQATTDSPIGAGTHQEYGSKYSVMGAANLNAYNSFERVKITWLAPADVVTVNANAGTYRIYNADKTTLTATHPYGLRIYKDSLVYNVEYRPDWDPAATHFSTSNGALMLWSQGTELPDMNPLTAAGNDDAPLLVGRSFHDPAQGLTVTPIAIGGTAPDNYMDLVVNITNTVANSAPVTVVTASNYAPATGVAVTLTATASDPDGDALAYAWDFGAAQSWTVLTGAGVSGTFALSNVTNDATGKVASNYGTFAVQQTATAVNLTWTPFAPIAVWRNLQFGANASNAAISGDFVDVEKDGFVNLMEYALGLNPNVFNTGGRPSGVVEGAYLTITYTRAKTATDITLRAVWSTGLGGWSTTGITEEILLDDGTIQTVKAKVLTAPDAKKFLRLEATRP